VTEATPINVQDSIQAAAWVVSQRYRGFVEQDDLVQEGWIYVLEHKDQVEGFQNHENPKTSQWYFNRKLEGCMDSYARRQKAHQSGYEPDDDLFVSDVVINLVLPQVLKDDPTPPVQAGERVANTSDPAEGGVWLATYMDVKLAWEKADLTGPQRDLMVAYYRDEFTQLELANQMKLSQQTVAKRLKQARAKLILQLGGYKPEEPGSTAHHPGAKNSDQAKISALR
jgi:RNA polymerase sigma factor (sigma-70 family)